MNKSDVTQELVNIFPSWSKTRTDEQSVGQQILNVFGKPLTKLDKQLRLLRDNQYLTTANLDEIDLTSRVQLGTTFEFDEDTTDPLFYCPIAPTVSGEYSSTWIDVELAPDNTIQSFWYDSIPNRATLGVVISGENHLLLTIDASDTPVSGVYEHHLNGGNVWVEATGGTQYLTVEDNQVRRGKVVLEGVTRKGTNEEETLVFPWDQKQKSKKEWRDLNKVTAFEMEDAVQIDISSADFDNGPYMSSWNLKYSENRNKIDEFWNVGHSGVGGLPTLDKVHYISDDWQQLVLGFSDKDVISSWELLEETDDVMSGINITVSGVDMAIQPFTDRAWVVTSDNNIRIYDLAEDTVSGVDSLKDLTPGADILIDYDDIGVLLGEDIEFEPWHARPLKEILSYRVWYQRPDGNKFGLLDGVTVPFTSDFRVKVPGTKLLDRTVESAVSIPTTMRGEYLVVFEATFVDGEEQNYRRVFRTRYKTPERTIDVSGLVPDPIDGIDFDSDQQLWVEAAGAYYRLDLHTDIMLIDYDNKIIYFKEPYDEVRITTNG